MRGEQVGLIPRKHGAHEANDRRIARLMDSECVKKAFDHDGAAELRTPTAFQAAGPRLRAKLGKQTR